ncbi:hypothetical protein PI124_g16988 [Phytophthora idaei]|nr:hypothetical protein PI125_g17406 [Phytophthora idaei]KAG3140797.1 hypothetical protein PI126_g15815 [Phytophthora idaei]KAG3238046.1 hypothetical protein PI124_g16988 [Phytophthora idaei]
MVTGTSARLLQGGMKLLGSLLPDQDGSGDEASDDSAWKQESDESSGFSSAEDAENAPNEESDAESLDEFAAEGRIVLIDDQPQGQVTSLIRQDTCSDRCREDKAAELENSLSSLLQMSAQEKKQNILTSLAMLMKTDTAGRRRGTGERQVFSYYLPLTGRLCQIFMRCLRSLYGYCHSLPTADTTGSFLGQHTPGSAEH